MLIVGVRMSGGSHYEHITRVRWKMISSSAAYDGEASVQEVIVWIRKPVPVYSAGHQGASAATVYVNNRAGREFIESRADSTPLNNLLSQPRF